MIVDCDDFTSQQNDSVKERKLSRLIFEGEKGIAFLPILFIISLCFPIYIIKYLKIGNAPPLSE